MKSRLACSTIDEALLGVLSLALALVLISGASKAEYGVFALVWAIILLSRGVQISLVLTPLATIGGHLRGRERVAFVRALARFHVAVGVVLALAVGGGISIVVGEAGWPLAVGSGIALVGTWLREFRRALAVLEEQNGGALAGDALFAILAVGATFGLRLLSGEISAGGILAASGIAAGVAAFTGFPGLAGEAAPATGMREVARAAFAQARWTLPGAAIGWGQQSGYVYAVGLALGTAAVGEMVAARLFVTPILLVAVAWGRMFMPQATSLLVDGGEAVLLARCGRALRMALVGSGIYVAIVAGAVLLGVGRLFPAEYAGGEVQVLAWAGFAIINLIRTIASTAMMARLEFRSLFAMTCVAGLTTLVLVVALIGPLGPPGAIGGMAGGELLWCVLAWRALLWRREARERTARPSVAPSSAF